MFPDLQAWVAWLEQLRAQAESTQRTVSLWSPIATPGGLLAPLYTVTAFVTLAVLVGVAVGTLTTLLITLVGLYYLLTEVFGVEIDIPTMQ